MLLPKVNTIESQVKILVDYCTSKGYSFSCFDITRQLRQHNVAQTINHDEVRSAVEKYFFETNLNSNYKREVTRSIEGEPQIYLPPNVSVSSYDKNFLDPLRVEAPPNKTLSQLVKEQIKGGKATEKSLIDLLQEFVKSDSSPSTKITSSDLGFVYAVKHKTQNKWARRGGSSTDKLSGASFWGSVNGPTQSLRHCGSDWQIVSYQLS